MRLQAWSPAVSFQVKVALTLAAVVLLLGIGAVIYARSDMRRILRGELETRGIAIAQDLATSSTDLVLTSDAVELYDLVNRTKANNPEVRYILVIDHRGAVRANTFGNSVPRGLVTANQALPGERTRLRRFDTEEGIVHDIAASVFDGKAGMVRVGLSDSGVQQALARNTRYLMVMVMAAVIIGLVVSYWASYYLTRPLIRLVEAVRSVGRGDFSERIDSPGRDEVGRLGRAFNHMAEELQRKEAARRELMEKVISSQEEERKRVARELHDDLAQQLSTVLLNLEAVDSRLADPESQRLVRQARQIAEGSLAETRKLIGDLRPTVLDDLGLLPAIRSYAESHLTPVGTVAHVTARDVPLELPPSTELTVYRILQESINNIAKHAKAKSATISLSATNDTLLCQVSDDGCGFDPAALAQNRGRLWSGVGLQGMEERARLLRAKLSVTSKPGRGTTVTLQVSVTQGVTLD